MALVPGDLTSGEMTFGRLDRLPEKIGLETYLRQVWLSGSIW